jgi:hypothetical protein
VQISNTYNLRRATEFRTELGEQLRPAVKRGAQKRKTVLGHRFVLGLKICSDNLNLGGEP